MDAEPEEPIPPTPPRTTTPEPIQSDSPEMEEVEDPIPKKGEESTRGANSGGRRRVRRRKQVNKTYMDKDGFMGKSFVYFT